MFTGKNYIEKNGGDNLDPGINIRDRDGRADNPGTDTNRANIDGELDNPGIGKDTTNIGREADNPSIGIDTADTNRGADNSSTDINITNIDDRANKPGISPDKADIDINGRADLNIGTDIAETDKGKDKKADNLGIRITDISGVADNSRTSTGTTNANRQASASNKAYVSLFSLHKAFFNSSSKLEIISTFLSSWFVSSISLVISIK